MAALFTKIPSMIKLRILHPNGFINLIIWLLIGIISTVCIDFVNYGGLDLVTNFILGLIVITVLYDFNLSLILFIWIYIFSDIFSIDTVYDVQGMSSVHSIYIGPFSLSVYMILFYFVVGCRGCLPRIPRDSFLPLLYPIMSLGIIFGIFNILESTRYFINQIAPYIIFILGFLITGMLGQNKIYHMTLLRIFAALFAGKSLVVLFKYTMHIGTESAYMLLPLYDPIGSFPLLLLGIALSLIFIRQRFYNVAIFLFLISVATLIFMTGRSLLVLAIFYLVLSFCFYIRFNGIRLRLFMMLACIAIPIFFTLSAIDSEYVSYLLWRVNELFGVDGGVVGGVRTAEFYNIVMNLYDKYSIIQGLGFGSSITDSYYPFMQFDNIQTAYTSDELSTGMYFNMHEQPLRILMQSGLFGLIVYGYFIISPVRYIKKVIYIPSLLTYLIALYLPFLQLMLVGFTVKSFFVAGILYAEMYILSNNEKSQKSFSY
jgi:hypothetical protein